MCIRDSAGAYLITGGLGALGLLTAKVLVKRGARRLVLLSRSGRVSNEGQDLERELQWLQDQPGVIVETVRCDVSDESSLSRVLSEVRRTGPIEGVVHSAGVLRDALIRGGGAESGSVDVWNSKARSARLLHEGTSTDDLRLFLTYSSIAAAYGISLYLSLIHISEPTRPY